MKNFLRPLTKVVFLSTFLFTFISQSSPLKDLPSSPSLVLVLVYDQFRADMLTRSKDRFLPAQKASRIGGFRYLMQSGAYFPLAEYEVLQSMTCPGHAMILSGSYPYANGIALNDFYDRDSGQYTYCLEDKEFGVSPRRFHGDTVGDELKMNSPLSKVVGLSLKDRSAILLGGKSAHMSLWLDSDKMEWTSSGYYPDIQKKTWLQNVNRRLSVLKDSEIIWKPSLIKDSFSHKGKAQSGEGLGSPLGLQITNQVAIEIIKNEKLGQRGVTDVLAISFSTHDISGHKYGPNSPEMEELTLQEDLKLSELLNEIAREIPGGLKNVVIALTADHGMAPLDSFAKNRGLDAGRIDQEEMAKQLSQEITKFSGAAKNKKEWVTATKSFNFYFNSEFYEKDADKKTHLLHFAQSWMLKQPGVAFVQTSDDYSQRILPPEMLGRQVLKTYIPKQSGDLVLIPKPFWYEVAKNAATHMTGYAYDRSVPLIIVSPYVKAGVYPSAVKVVDLAPTLSFLLRQNAPALSEGRVLSEIFEDKK